MTPLLPPPTIGRCSASSRSFLPGPAGPAGTPPGQALRPGALIGLRDNREHKQDPYYQVSTVRGEPRTFGNRVKEGYHAVADQDTKVGKDWAPSVLTCAPGQALCGARGPWRAAPEGLFPPLVSCGTCRDIAAREHITITGLPATITVAGRP